MLRPSAEWWSAFFDDTFADVVLASHELALLESTLDFLVAQLALRPGDRVFDQGCGIGRMSIPLAARGFEVVGVDLSAPYVERARAEARERNVHCELHVGDAFHFAPGRPCAAAINWATSFGLAEDDASNLAMLRRACESLVPGGRFGLEFANTARVLRDLNECMVTRPSVPGGEAIVVRDTHANVVRGMFEQRWTYILPDGRRHVRHGGTRMYLPHELRNMLKEAGFARVDFFGSVQGESLELSSPRCIAIAHKPGER